MYEIGDKVMHPQEGACYIENIRTMKMGEMEKEYYILAPLIDKKAILYIPILKERDDRLRPVLSEKKMKELKRAVCQRRVEWVESSRHRQKMSTEVIRSGDFSMLLEFIKMMLERQKEKELGSKDKEFLLNAQKIAYSEMAMIQECSYDNIKLDFDEI